MIRFLLYQLTPQCTLLFMTSKQENPLTLEEATLLGNAVAKAAAKVGTRVTLSKLSFKFYIEIRIYI